MTDIFEFWSQIKRGQRVHPADVAVFGRMLPETHGFNLNCLPAAFAGRLRTAPVVLLYLSPGFKDRDLQEAQTSEGQDYYVRRWTGSEPLQQLGADGTSWMASRTRSFGAFEAVRDKVALLNIGCYHSKDVKSYSALLALPSSRVSLNWAQSVLFPSAEAGERVVICMRSARYWGLKASERYGAGLFAPLVTRHGHFVTNKDNRELIDLVRQRVSG